MLYHLQSDLNEFYSIVAWMHKAINSRIMLYGDIKLDAINVWAVYIVSCKRKAERVWRIE